MIQIICMLGTDFWKIIFSYVSFSVYWNHINTMFNNKFCINTCLALLDLVLYISASDYCSNRPSKTLYWDRSKRVFWSMMFIDLWFLCLAAAGTVSCHRLLLYGSTETHEWERIFRYRCINRPVNESQRENQGVFHVQAKGDYLNQVQSNQMVLEIVTRGVKCMNSGNSNLREAIRLESTQIRWFLWWPGREAWSLWGDGHRHSKLS
jgi:hypothetical protein